MTTLDKSVFEDLHNKYETLKIVCKECFLRTSEAQDPTHESSESSEKIDMPELEEHFEMVLGALNDVLQHMNPTTKHYIRLIVMKSSIYYEQAKTLVTNNKEVLAKDLLSKGITLLKNYSTHPDVCFLYLRMANHYSYLLSKNTELDKARALLEETETIYEQIRNSSNVKIYNSDDIFTADEKLTLREDTAFKLEKLVTNNLQMLGWVYSKQGLHAKFAVYHHEVLRRQLEMRDGNALIWVLKTARLASYFLSVNNFHQARHHLAAASSVIEEYESDLKKYEMTESMLLKWKELQHYYADVAKCWVKYGLYLISVSKTRMVQAFYGDTNPCLEDLWVSPFGYLTHKKKIDENEMKQGKEKREVDKIKINIIDGDKETGQQEKETVSPEGDTKLFVKDDGITQVIKGATGDASVSEKDDVTESLPDAKENKPEALLRFPTLSLEELENQVSADYVQSTEQARELFVFTHTWLKRSKMFYTIKDHPLEYINAILDLSELYRFLAFYEDDVESQYNVQKRRADSLETLSAVLREVRPQCYMAVSIELLRELAEVQMEMMGLNLRRLYLAQDATNTRESTLHKMEAVADIHARLEQFGTSLSQGTMGLHDFDDPEEEESETDADNESEADRTSNCEACVQDDLSSETESVVVS